jgi:hypothetical protein
VPGTPTTPEPPFDGPGQLCDGLEFETGRRNGHSVGAWGRCRPVLLAPDLGVDGVGTVEPGENIERPSRVFRQGYVSGSRIGAAQTKWCAHALINTPDMICITNVAATWDRLS